MISTSPVTINATVVTAHCDVVANGISLIHHTHPDPRGGSTSPPQQAERGSFGR